MHVYAWVCLGAFVAASVPASLAALVATIRLFRGLKAAVPDLEVGFERLAAGADTLVVRSERAAAGMVRTEESVRRLAASRTQLATLAWALEDVRRIVRTVRAVLPSG